MLRFLIAWAVLIYFFYIFLFKGFLISDSFLLTVAILSIAAIALFLISLWKLLNGSSKKHKNRTAPSRPAPTAPQAARVSVNTRSESFSFRVAGTTHKNEDGSSRQTILRHMKNGDSPWVSIPDDFDVTFEDTEYEGELAIAVYLNDYQVGFVPRKDIARIVEARKRSSKLYVSDVQIIGGGENEEGEKMYYGCLISIEY